MRHFVIKASFLQNVPLSYFAAKLVLLPMPSAEINHGGAQWKVCVTFVSKILSHFIPFRAWNADVNFDQSS